MADQKKIQIFDDLDLVVLRNPVAKARFHLSVYQTKFLLEVLSHLKSKPEARILSFNIRQFNKSLNLDNNDIKYYVNEIRKMVRHVVSIPTEERKDGGMRFKDVALIAAIDTDIDGKGEGSIKIEVADMIKPYFLEIANGQFFSFNKYNARVLKGRYSISLYMLLKSYQRFRTLQIDYEELRDILEIKTEEYRPFKEFKRWILEKSRKEMMEKNDIFFDYDVIRMTLSKKSDVSKIVFHIRNNPNHAEIFRQFQIKEGKIKEPIVLISDISQPQTGENSELFKGNLFEHLSTSFIHTDSFDSQNTEIIRLFRVFDAETPDTVLGQFIDSLYKAGFSEERILDVLYYAYDNQSKGEKIRNIMGYVKHGLETGTMGTGLANKKIEQGRIEAVQIQYDTLIKDSKFTAWLQQYYIKRGIEAPNDEKIAFLEATKKIRAMAHYFDENGQLKETEKDNLRASLGKKIAHTEGVKEEVLFIQWIYETQGIVLKKIKNKWEVAS
ncbi:MAG: replication initiation protein [Saprospiraceae bacterium]|nr:replication initiation protein [Saprospiraceae bacterium]